MSYDKLAAEFDVKPCQMLGNHCTVKQMGIPDWGRWRTPSHPKTLVRNGTGGVDSTRLMSSDLRDSIATTKHPGKLLNRGLGRRHVAPGALLMLCVFSPVYAAGKAATSGVPSIYAPSTYAHLSPAKTPPPPAMIPMGPLYTGYSGDFDRNSSGEALGTARSSWWEVEGSREAGPLAIKGSGVGRGNWGQGAGNAGFCS